MQFQRHKWNWKEIKWKKTVKRDGFWASIDAQQCSLSSREPEKSLDVFGKEFVTVRDCDFLVNFSQELNLEVKPLNHHEPS